VTKSAAEEWNEQQNRQAERDWRAKTHQGRTTQAEGQVVAHVQAPETVPGTSLAHPLEVNPADFKKALALRTENRVTLVTWLRDALKEGHDFGRLHVISKEKCKDGNRCQIEWHWSKDQLFKPGAEKVCGMLGVTPTFPNLHEYEQAAVKGVQIRSVILKCQIVAINKAIVAEGVGAASITEKVDLNKALKMAQKSAHIDATLRMAGLSEIFCTPDAPPEPKNEGQPRVSIGKHQGELWADIDIAYVRHVVGHKATPAAFKREAQAELDRRPEEFDFDDSERL
jgi:hypothetical protein